MTIPTVTDTHALIKCLHAGQTDHSGKPYVSHPIRVSKNLQALQPAIDDDVVMAALLHDTIEDCDIEAGDLLEKGYSKRCVDAVLLVTKPKGDKRSYAQVIGDLVASGNRDAMLVKLADNMDNLHPKRVRAFTEKNPEKAKRLGLRYREAIAKLCAATHISEEKVHGLIEKQGQMSEAW